MIAEAVDSPVERDPIDQAWRIHGAIVSWTGSVDSKASFALAIESAVTGAVIGMAGGQRALAHLEDFPQQACFWTGLTALVIALVLVALVVRPRLRARKMKEESASNIIYFGHLVHWEADDLTEALRSWDLLPVLSRQIVNMSKVAWRKHRLLWWSMTLAVLGSSLLTTAAYLNVHA